MWKQVIIKRPKCSTEIAIDEPIVKKLPQIMKFRVLQPRLVENTSEPIRPRGVD
jgi:hypothetical protein